MAFKWTDEDTRIVLFLTLFFTVARYSLQALVRVFLRNSKALIGVEIAPPNTHQKFSESFWKFLFYTVIFVWAWFVVVQEDFFWEPYKCFTNLDAPVPLGFKYYYLSQLAFYLHSAITHFTIEVRRGDFLQMLLHHVVTSILVALSYAVGYHRIGGILYFLHDGNDVILEFGKMFVYMKKKAISDFLFAVLIVDWLVTRVVLYAAIILKTSMFTAPAMIKDIQYYYPFNVMLFIIWGLNIFWYYLLIKMAVLVVFKKQEINDIREDEDDTKPKTH